MKIEISEEARMASVPYAPDWAETLADELNESSKDTLMQDECDCIVGEIHDRNGNYFHPLLSDYCSKCAEFATQIGEAVEVGDAISEDILRLVEHVGKIHREHDK